MTGAKLTRQLLGMDESHLMQQGEHRLHKSMVADWFRLKQSATEQGFALTIASAHRNYERQLAIWNAKASGERTVLDDDEQPVELQCLSNEEKLWAILRWSALPGASRHHWGTDIDVYDAAAIPDGYRLRLVLEETERGGLFESMHQWLDRQIESDQSYGFYRPYTKMRKKGEHGVAAEPWHLSHRVLSEPYRQALNKQRFLEYYSQSENLALKKEIICHFDQIYESYIDID